VFSSRVKESQVIYSRNVYICSWMEMEVVHRKSPDTIQVSFFLSFGPPSLLMQFAYRSLSFNFFRGIFNYF
jgi:hypothetical protein